MKKIVSVLLFIIMISVSFKVFALEYDDYKAGELVSYNGIKFYVMFDSDTSSESVRLIKMTPFTHDEINKYTDNKPIALCQSGNLVFSKSENGTPSQGYGYMNYYQRKQCGNSSSDNVTDYDLSSVKIAVENWVSDTFNDDDLVTDEYGYKARIINYDELKNFYDIKSTYVSEYELLSLNPEWLFRLSYNSWTMYKYYNDYVYLMNYYFSDSYVNLKIWNVYNSATVRPVVNIKKSAISNNSSNEYSYNKNIEYKTGDIVNYNDIKFYVIRPSMQADSKIFLLKASPFTTYELYKYGSGYINNHLNTYSYPNHENTVVEENGLSKVIYISKENCNSRDSSGCSVSYEASNVKNIVDNWILQNVNLNDMIADDSGYFSRLLNNDDFSALGYISSTTDTNGIRMFKPSNDTPFFFLTDNIDSMLTMAIGDLGFMFGNREGILMPRYSGYDIQTVLPENALGTIRPVVILKKKEITNKITNVEEKEESDNIEVTIETKVDNSTFENNKLVSVPNTFFRKPYIIIFIGILLSSLGILLYRYNKKI